MLLLSRKRDQSIFLTLEDGSKVEVLPLAALPELRQGWLAVLIPVEEALRE